MTLTQDVKYIINTLYSHGFTAYAVGGCVRDLLMNNRVHDYDICTNALPQNIINIFGEKHTVPTGIKHGTITLILNKTPYEITTYRTETNYSDNRHPDSVCFVTQVEDDLKRRDFTINAMAYNDIDGLKDLYGGADDIIKKLVRCVGSADTRFKEDGLRILRALRFASVLDFSIEEKTRCAVFANKPLLCSIAPERLYSEFTKLLCGVNAEKVLLNYAEVLAVFMPQLKPMFGFNQHNPHHCFDVWHHSVKSAVAAPRDVLLRLTMLLHDIGKPKTFFADKNGVGHFYGHDKVGVPKALEILEFFHADNLTKETVPILIKYHDRPVEPTKKSIRRIINKLGQENFEKLLIVKRCDIIAQSSFQREEKLTNLNAVEKLYREFFCVKYVFNIKNLEINGLDIIGLGIPQGKYVGLILAKLLTSVQNEEIKNEKKELVFAAKEIISTIKNKRNI